MGDSYRSNLQDISPNNKLTGFYRGTIVDTADPLARGRARIRIFGIHTQLIEKQVVEGIPDEELPWAEQVAPAMGGTSGNGFFGAPTKGSIVWCFFANGDPMRPIYFGVQFGATVIVDGTGTLSGNNPAKPATSQPAQESDNGEGGEPDNNSKAQENTSNAKDLCEVAQKRGYDPCMLKAVSVVESGGRNGLIQSGANAGKPVIRFESHWFSERVDPATRAKYGHDKELITYHWKDSVKYSKKNAWATYEKAKAINPNAAFDSTSWGKYQIMGAYWKNLGYGSRAEMEAAASDPGRQEELLDRFITMKTREGLPLDSAIKNNNFREVARYYNGEKNINGYAPKIQAEYKKCKAAPEMCAASQGSGEGGSGQPEKRSINVKVL